MVTIKRDESGRFLQGKIGGPGRPTGSKNHKPVDLIEIATQVAREPISEDEAREQLRTLRRQNPLAFLSLLDVLGSPPAGRPELVC